MSKMDEAFSEFLHYIPACTSIPCGDCRLYDKKRENCIYVLLVCKKHIPENPINVPIDEYVLLLEEFITANRGYSTNYVCCRHTGCDTCNFRNNFYPSGCLTAFHIKCRNIDGWEYDK